MYAFLLGLYPRSGIVGHRVCMCSAVLDAVSFPKWLIPFTYMRVPYALHEDKIFSKAVTYRIRDIMKNKVSPKRNTAYSVIIYACLAY